MESIRLDLKKGERAYSLSCQFICDAITRPDASGQHIELQKVLDPCLYLYIKGGWSKFLPLSEFKNGDGDSITDILCNQNNDFTEAMIAEEIRRWEP